MKKNNKKGLFQKLLCIVIVAIFFALAVGSSGPKSADEWNDWIMEMNDMETEAKKDNSKKENLCPICEERKCAKGKTICKECLENFENLGWEGIAD